MISSDVLLGAGLCFAATTLGAAGVLTAKYIDRRAYPIILSFAAGVMAFSVFEMLGEAHALAGHMTSAVGVAIGMLAICLLEKLIPHAHFMLRKKEMEEGKKKAALIAGAIALHNVPEGFAVASAFAGAPALGWTVAISIALQDVPEGLAVSAPLSYYGSSMKRSFLWGVFSGVVEAAAALIGYAFLSTAVSATPLALALSAGAMAYVVIFDLMKESFAGKDKQTVVLAFISGMAGAFMLTALLAP